MSSGWRTRAAVLALVAGLVLPAAPALAGPRPAAPAPSVGAAPVPGSIGSAAGGAVRSPRLAQTDPAPSTVAPAAAADATGGGAGNDAAATRTVNRIIAALVALGALVLILTVWYWKATSPLHPALEGLELMSSRKFVRASPAKRARLLDSIHAARGVVGPRVVPDAPPVRAPVGAAPRR